MRMTRTHCPRCRAEHVFDTETGQLRMATPEDEPRFCTNRPASRLRCNWLGLSAEPLCYACGLTATTPLLEIRSNLNAFRRFEESKRRLVAALMRMKLLPLYGYTTAGARLRFHLKQDRRDNPLLDEDEVVMTGHLHGDITLNIRETDRIGIEATKRAFNEKYRTTLGTLRHEVGHYFFLALVTPVQQRLERFRELFGDERQDYDAALAHYYSKAARRRRRRQRNGAYISEYAQSHPHEDWAETWAHFMHMEDALAVSSFIGIDYAHGGSGDDRFALTVTRWECLSWMANALNLSMGHAPAYPFQLTEKVQEKMRFVADTIDSSGGSPYMYAEH